MVISRRALAPVGTFEVALFQILHAESVAQHSPGQSLATQSRGAALGNRITHKRGRELRFPINRRVAETATSRGLFRPRQTGEHMVARALGR